MLDFAGIGEAVGYAFAGVAGIGIAYKNIKGGKDPDDTQTSDELVAELRKQQDKQQTRIETLEREMDEQDERHRREMDELRHTYEDRIDALTRTYRDEIDKLQREVRDLYAQQRGRPASD